MSDTIEADEEDRTYTIDELSPEARERALDRHRDWNTDLDQWWDCVYDDAKRLAAMLGIDIEDIWFSGFWSQGDGACFEGRLGRCTDEGLIALVGYASQDEELHRIAREWYRLWQAAPELYAGRVLHTGRYYHEHSVSFDWEWQEDSDETSEDKMADTEHALEEAARDLMRWIYRRLEDEHDYLTSDEAIIEGLEANEMRFDEDGEDV